MNIRFTTMAALIAAALATAAGASAQTVRIGNQGDALSMDPHSLNESLQLSVTGNVYEPLVGRDSNLRLTPALATSWKQTSPTVWRFELRKGVKFHDGSPFTADDVIFSFGRIKQPQGTMGIYVAGIAMTVFGRHPDRSLHDLAGEALVACAQTGTAPEAALMRTSKVRRAPRCRMSTCPWVTRSGRSARRFGGSLGVLWS